MFISISKKLKKITFSLKKRRLFILNEFNGKHRKNSIKSIKFLSKGFYSDAPLIYDFKNKDKKDYLSDWQWLKNGFEINGPQQIILDDKLLFHITNKNNPHVPKILFITKNNQLYRVDELPEKMISISAEEFKQSLKNYPQGLIAKPYKGSHGQDIYKIQKKNEHLYLNDKRKSIQEILLKFFNFKSSDFLITEFIKQTGEIHELYPHSLNTIRLLTMQDPSTGEPFIARAILRLGTKKSGFTDNWFNGGMSININIETGQLGYGAINPFKEKNINLEKKIVFRKSHPDSKKNFYGNKIPNWENIKNGVLNLSKNHFYLPYIGWDVAPMENGFIVLEGNINSGIRIIQVHEPLLTNNLIKKFYEYHGMI